MHSGPLLIVYSGLLCIVHSGPVWMPRLCMLGKRLEAANDRQERATLLFRLHVNQVPRHHGSTNINEIQHGQCSNMHSREASGGHKWCKTGNQQNISLMYCIPSSYFQTQLSLGSDLWVCMSFTDMIVSESLNMIRMWSNEKPSHAFLIVSSDRSSYSDGGLL